MTTSMMIVLGLVQGLTEFLPISSSGHFVITTAALHWPDIPAGLEIALHLGTLLAVVVYFWADWVAIIKGQQKGLMWSLFWATLVTGALAYISGPYRTSIDHRPILTAYMLMIFGMVLWLVDWRARQLPPRSLGATVNCKAPTFWQSVYLGLAQVMALIPGVSRSGIVITAARSLRMNKEEAARYAFLLSAPAIALTPVALLLNRTGGEPFVINGAVIVGAMAAFLSGLLAISFLLSLVKRVSFGWFALYRILLAVVILIIIK